MADPVYNRAAWRRARAFVLDRDQHLCQLCGAQAEAVDHIIPISAGGPHYDPHNLRAICTACNSSRVARPNQRPALLRPSREW